MSCEACGIAETCAICVALRGTVHGLVEGANKRRRFFAALRATFSVESGKPADSDAEDKEAAESACAEVSVDQEAWLTPTGLTDGEVDRCSALFREQAARIIGDGALEAGAKHVILNFFKA